MFLPHAEAQNYCINTTGLFFQGLLFLMMASKSGEVFLLHKNSRKLRVEHI